MNSTDAKQSAGYFKEKAVIGLSAFTGSEIEKSVLKATSHMLKAPKEKYVQKLVAASYGQYGTRTKERVPTNERIVRELEKRSHVHNWIVVLKTMVAFHRLLCDASDDMAETICLYRNIFNQNHIKNLTETADGAGQAYFINQYVTYLEERCAMQSALGRGRRIEIPEFEEYLNTLNAETLQPVFEILLRLLEALSAVQYHEIIVNNFCTMEAYQLLVKDGKRVFQLLSKRVIFVLDGFEEFTLAQKKLWYNLYRRYDSAFLALKAFFDSILRSSRVFVEPIPQLKPLPPSLAARLESDIRASEVPTDAPCTLESLGISTKETKPEPPKKEAAPLPPAPKQQPVAETPKPAPHATPAVPTFSMDDLFVSTPEPPKPAPAATFAPDRFAFEQFAPSTPPTAPPAPDQGGWNTGSPAGWTSGSPQAWGSGAPGAPYGQQPSTQSQAFYTGSPAPAPPPFHAQSPSASNPAAPASTSKKPADPFKDLYDQSQRKFT